MTRRRHSAPAGIERPAVNLSSSSSSQNHNNKKVAAGQVMEDGRMAVRKIHGRLSLAVVVPGKEKDKKRA